MNDLTKEQKIKHILTFLFILFGETSFINAIMNMSPDYILEKWDYLIINKHSEVISQMHVNLIGELYIPYFKHWGLNYG